MMRNIELQHIADQRLNIMHPRVTKLNNFVAIRANQMIMLLRSITPLKLCQILSELMLADQITFNQQIQSIIHRRSANTIILVFHVDIEHFDIKVPFSRINFLQNCITLGRFTECFIFEISCKNFFYVFNYFLFGSHFEKVRFRKSCIELFG